MYPCVTFLQSSDFHRQARRPSWPNRHPSGTAGGASRRPPELVVNRHSQDAVTSMICSAPARRGLGAQGHQIRGHNILGTKTSLIQDRGSSSVKSTRPSALETASRHLQAIHCQSARPAPRPAPATPAAREYAGRQARPISARQREVPIRGAWPQSTVRRRYSAPPGCFP